MLAALIPDTLKKKKSIKHEANGETMRVFLGKGVFKANVIDHISVFWPPSA